MIDRTDGDLVAERPGRSRILHRHGIDFCCQGARTLGEACDGSRVAVEAVLGEFAAEVAQPAAKVPNPAALPLHELCAYIVETHHGYLRRELPRLRTMAQQVAAVHGRHTPSLIEVSNVYMALADELASHVLKEENILFPAIVAMSCGESCFMPLDGPITCMLHEHDDAGHGLARLRELTNGFEPPADACNTYRALFAGLLELEDDLHRHIHLENSVVFPQAQAMVTRA
jgi:regulator of cell morphogenesis and NO signaling